MKKWTEYLKQNISKLWLVPIYLFMIVALVGVFSVYRDVRSPIAIQTQVEKLVPVVEYRSQPVKTVTITRTVKVLVPTTKQEDRLKVDFHFNPETELAAGIFDLKPLPNGGSVLVTVDKETGKVEPIIRPNKEEFFHFGGQWFASAEYHLNQDVRISGGKDLFKLGPGHAYAGIYHSNKEGLGLAIGYMARF